MGAIATPRKWTREAVLDAIRAFHSRYGSMSLEARIRLQDAHLNGDKVAQLDALARAQECAPTQLRRNHK